MAREAVDPITVEVLRNRIACLTAEMDYHFYRSGYSTIIRESRDFSCAVLDPSGRLPVAPPMFFHGPVYRHLIGRILDIYGTEGLADGDVIVSNHPYEGNLPHVPDMAVVAPIFADGALIGFAGSIAHKADVGGTVPGSTYGQATELFQEGLLLPPVKLYRAGAADDGLHRLIAANSRAPDLVLGDLGGQVGVLGLGRERIQAICRNLGRETYAAALTALIDGAAAAFRDAIAGLPEGTHEAEGFIDNDGVDRDAPVRLHVRVTVASGVIEFDFSGTAAQTRGPINLRRALVEACCFHAPIGVLGPELRYSDALHDLVRFRFAPRSLLAPEPPAPVSSYMTACHKLVDVLLDALGRFRPERAVAHGGGSGGALTIAWQGGGRWQAGNQYEIFGSAFGAGAAGDGASGVSVHLANIHITPIEIIETEFPCRITTFETIAGSGGDGAFHGGRAMRRAYELLAPATVIYRGDRARFAPRGLAGGGDGAPSRFVLAKAGGAPETMPSSCRLELAAGDAVIVETAAGGGYGAADAD